MKTIPWLNAAPKLLVAVAIAVAVLGMPAQIAMAHDFGGTTGSASGDPPPPPKPPCDSCSCSAPGGSEGSEGGTPGNSSDSPSASGGKPVAFFNGAEEMVVTDLVVKGVFPIVIQRKYDSLSTYDSPLGFGWAFFHDRRLYEYSDNSVIVRHGCGTRDRYVPGGGGYVSPVGSMLTALKAENDGSFRLEYLNGTSDIYDSQGRLVAVTDIRGNRHEFTYDSRGKLPLTGSSKESLSPTQPTTVAYNYRLTRIDARAPNGVLTGRSVSFGYNEATGRLISVTADDGRAVTYQHDQTAGLTLGNLTQVTGLENIVASYGYSDARDPHNLTSITPSQGRTPIVNTYDDQDRVIRQEEGTRRMDIVYDVPFTRTTVTKTISDQNGQNSYTSVWSYEFDPTGRVTKMVDPLGHEVRYAYDGAKMLARKETWQKNGGVLTLLQAMDWTYDSRGNKLAQTVTLDGGETLTRSWTYRQDWVESEQIVSSAAPTKVFRTEYMFNFGPDGRPINVQSEKRRRDNGSFQTTSYTYDSRNRPLTTTLPDGVQMVNEYTGDYVTRVYWLVNGSSVPQMQRRFEYDSEGNRIKEWDARDNLTQIAYDRKRRIVRVTNPLGEQTVYTYAGDKLAQAEMGRTAAAGEGQVTKYLYDSRDRLIGMQRKNDAGAFVNFKTMQLDSEGKTLLITDAENRSTRMAYDVRERMSSTTDALGNTVQLRYDAAGNRVAMIDALNRETRWEFDDLDRMKAMVEVGVSPNPRTEYSYDANGNVVSVKDPEGRVTSYQFDALSRNTRVTQPLGQFVQYSYDTRDRLSSVINARGGRIDFAYEAWGPVNVERQYPTSAGGTPERTITYVRDNDGNVTSIVDSDIQSAAAYAMTYDSLSRISDETVKYLPGGDRILRHRYDRYGNRKEVTLQDADPVTSTYSYNKLNQLTSATLDGASIGMAYYANDDVRTVTLPNGVTESYTYRRNGPVENIRFVGPSGQLEQLAYTYDSVLHLDTQTDRYGLHDFNYDGLDRLTQALRPAAAGLPNESYAYDRVGNREAPGNAALFNYDNNNRLTSAPGLTNTFDQDGSLLTRSDGTIFTYDVRKRMRRYEKAGAVSSYLLDPVGRRIRKAVGSTTTWYLWDGNRLLAEYDAAGARTKRYGYVGEDLAATQFEELTRTYYVHADHLRTPRFMTNPAGQVAWRSRHEAFGKAVIEPDVDADGTPIAFNLRFPGQYFDAESGLHYNFLRDYDPATGRYVESDPIGLDGGINPYAYVEGDPLMLVDPYGLFGTRDALGFVPVVGSALDAYDAAKCGNYGLAAFNAGLAVLDATGAAALVKGLTVGTMRWGARATIRDIYKGSSSWNQMRRRLQDAGELTRNSRSTARSQWMTTDHVFIKQRAGKSHALTNHPANLQTDITQSLNSQFEFMSWRERAKYLPGWMKLAGAGVASFGAGLFTGSGCGCEK